jgi:hypothetical protein
VDIVKVDVDTLSTVPAAPPAAGPDRALDPPLPDPGPPEAPLPGTPCPAVAEGDVAATEGDVAGAEGDVEQPAESPITAHISAAATIPTLFLFDNNRRTLGLAMIAEAEVSGGGSGAAPAPPERAATGVPDVVLDAGEAGKASWALVGSFMMALLSHRQQRRECWPFM